MKHPGQIFKEHYLDPIDIRAINAARIMELGESYISDFIQGRINLDKKLARRIEADFGGTEISWLKMQKEYDAR